jgi:hypothetical protein
MDNESEKALSGEELRSRIVKRLAQLEGMTFLETYAMFMGKAQIVEMGLKRLLFQRYGVSEEEMEKMTLGQAVTRLEQLGLRKDFISIARELVQYRNDLAHDFLEIDAFGKSLIGPEFQTLSEKQLRLALYSVEEVIQVYDHLDEHGYWDSIERPE